MRAWLLERDRLTDLRLLSGLAFPALAGLAFSGYRAAGVAACVIVGALAARAVLVRLRTWQTPLSQLSLAVQGLLLAMLLPGSLFDLDRAWADPAARWPLAAAAGLLLTLFTWAISRAQTARFSPLVITAIVISAAGARYNYVDRVLTRQHAFTGDLLSERVAARPTSTAEPWLTAPPEPGVDVWQIAPATRR
ncbi:MAG TPA: hypothetical protein VF624_11560, partial [Tepidisphaeraceae bacterium]